MANQSITPEFNITIAQNATYNLALTLLDSAGNARDLTGYTGGANIRKSLIDPDIVQAFTVTVSDPVNGRVDMSLTATQTAALDFERSEYVYDLMIKTGAVVEKVIQGSASLELSVTAI